MKLFGADFSGARNPSRGIYYAAATLEEGTLTIDQVVHCDDRLDLLAAIHFSKAPWGLDFPFSVSSEALKYLKIKNWDELLALVVKCERIDFNSFIESGGIPSCESRCQDHSIYCRANDVSTNAFSPLKKPRPNMRIMTYAGLKLLAYLRELGNAVYPFDRFDNGVSRLYEVYPSHGWGQVGLSRNKYLLPFVKSFSQKFNFKVNINNSLLSVESLDAADAVVACVTMAYAIDQYNIETAWGEKLTWINNQEWEQRFKEGLIVKVK